MKTVGIIVARLDSSRLPGKSLRLFAGRPLLDWLLDRLHRAKDVFDALVIATSDRVLDDALEAFALSRGVQCFRGSTEDVAGRVLAAAEFADATHFFRINGDSPCVTPELFREALKLAKADESLDFVTNLRPRQWPYGVACELFRTAAFRSAWSKMADQSEREHVSLHFYQHPEAYRSRSLHREGESLDHVRLTVDTVADAERFEQMLQTAGDRWREWTLDEIVDAATRDPRPDAA